MPSGHCQMHHVNGGTLLVNNTVRLGSKNSRNKVVMHRVRACIGIRTLQPQKRLVGVTVYSCVYERRFTGIPPCLTIVLTQSTLLSHYTHVTLHAILMRSCELFVILDAITPTASRQRGLSVGGQLSLCRHNVFISRERLAMIC